ncbi:hypothetical protein [Terrabacter sp. Ter38]|uniref:hypothetical protein n=1 Tax=Terrabacter sp. Ter38 TaxID=2926030 RepID=UPI00211745C4|nr:hypothetical protein [Terrabacter sp. Ter38]
MNTTSGTAITETAPTTVRTTASTTLTRIRSRLLAMLLVAGAIVGIGVSTAGSASAAVAPTNNFSAECSPYSVQAYAPDMGWYPNNAVVWYPTIYLWTTSGWQKYYTGPTQVALGDNTSGSPWSITGSWMRSSVTFSGLGHNRYFQVRVSYAWAGPNVDHLAHVDMYVQHAVAQGNFTYASYSRSTSSYCYIP